MSRGFRVARPGPTRRHLAATAGQIVLFWGTFLFVLPHQVHQLGAAMHEPTLAWPGRRWVAGALFAAASTLGLASAYCMAVHGRGTPLPLATARDFVVHGPYRWLRNPMALAGIAQGVAVGIWRGSPSVLAYAVAGGMLWHWVARPPEERDLRCRFGTPYVDYQATVPLWLPRFGGRAGDLTLAVALLLVAAACLVGPGPTSALAMAPLSLAALLLAAHLARRRLGPRN
jgi:protein-S-isoprenylcysteine O-methyltransferase Ste14